MDEKKVLIIAYYWPPSGGSGVQRWLKFVKYLPSYGWTPYIFTPENPSFDVQDKSLLKDVAPQAKVIHFPIWEPYEAFFKLSRILSGQKKTAKPTALVSGRNKSVFEKVSTWIRGNVFIPDPRRFWVRPSVKFLQKFLTDNAIHTIITTGPPHSLHLIGYQLKKRNPALNWIADFRDPWSEWGFLDSIMTGSLARKVHARLELKVLSTADKIITITPFYVKRFKELAKREVTLLTNGFDDDDFRDITYRKGPKFLIRHVGIVNEKCNPRPFMEAIKLLCRENADFKNNTVIEFIGDVHAQFKTYVETSEVLSALVKFTTAIPHKQLISMYGESSLLLLILTGYKDAEGYMPGKLFEYLATGLPVLAVGPLQGDAANLLNETQAGVIVDGDNTNEIKNIVLRNFQQWQNSDPSLVTRIGSGKYSRKAITAQLVTLLK